MQQVALIRELRATLRERRRAGARVALVPTMGALHDGHLSLVDAARARADVVVMSLFVNPLQFGASEDLAQYPRDLDGDARKAAARGVDLLFAPSVLEMYPVTPAVVLVPNRLGDRWEGMVRPGHFSGMLTVVAKLLHIVAPDLAVFGQKDYQQSALIRAMVRGLDLPVQIAVAPIVRDADGLALSSRNVFLSPDERRSALALPGALRAMTAARARGERRADALLDAGRAVLREEPEVAVDYLAIVDPDALEPVDEAEDGTVALVAARVGRTRLLDNHIFGAS